MGRACGAASPPACSAPRSAPSRTSLAQQHLRNVLAYLDVPTMGQPEAFIHYKEGFFDADGNVGEGSRKFLQTWMDKYVAWVKTHNNAGDHKPAA